MLPYIDHWTRQGLKLNSITRHMLMLFHGQPGSRVWKRVITENACRPGAGIAEVQEALAKVVQSRSPASAPSTLLSGDVWAGSYPLPLQLEAERFEKPE